MIDLTPLDVRKKRGDFAKGLRGYDMLEVDTFLELVAERMEELVKENLRLGDRNELLQTQVDASEGRERAVQEALVTAQELRADVARQAEREAELAKQKLRNQLERMVGEAEARLFERKNALDELERQRLRFLKAFRTLLEREMDAVEVEQSREPLEDFTIDLDLGGFLEQAGLSRVEPAPASPEAEVEGVPEVEDERDEEAAQAAPADQDLEEDEGVIVAEIPADSEAGEVEAGESENGGKAPLWLYDIEDAEDRG